MTHLQHHDAILDFWDPLIRQEVIEIESSFCMILSIVAFYYCRKFYPLVGVFAPPRNVKTMVGK